MPKEFAMEILGQKKLEKPELRRLHIYVQTNKFLRHLGRIELGKSDPSIYVYPYGRTGHYSYGVGSFENEEAVTTTFDFREQQQDSILPHLSIHTSGQCHIRNVGSRDPGFKQAGPLKKSTVANWSGQHVATIETDLIRVLPKANGLLSETPEEHNIVLNAKEYDSAALVLFLNGSARKFREPIVNFSYELARGAYNPAYLGACWTKKPLRTPISDARGVTLIGGWDGPARDSDNFLFLRAE